MADQTVVEVVPIGSLTPDAANVRRRDDRARKSLAASLVQFGPARSIVIDGKGIVRAGNGTVEAAEAAGCTEVLVVTPKPGQLVAVKRDDWSATEATGYGIADNRLGDLATFDDEALSAQLEALQAEEFDLDSLGFTEAEIDELIPASDGDGQSGDSDSQEPGSPTDPATRPTLAERFIVPPFSVLDARQGYWQDRKRKWLAIGIQSELGRGGNCLSLSEQAEDYRTGSGEYARTGGNACPGGSARPAMRLGDDGRSRRGDGRGRTIAATKEYL